MAAALLLDTHVWAWTFAADGLLSPAARRAIAAAHTVYVSPISFFEIGQKVRLGKWPELVPFAPRLVEVLRDQGGVAAPFTPEICLSASLRDWAHRDPIDRLLAATCEQLAVPLVTRDPAFAGLDGIARIW
jgi:PIN domain nuclease of toxin-antitoxin system